MNRNAFIPSRRGVMLGAAALATPWIARARTYRDEYRLTVVGNRPIPLSEGAFQFAEMVTERSGGRINIKVYPGSQLVGGDQTRELVAMRQGVADFGVFSSINVAPQMREWSLFQLPFLTPSHAAFDALLASPVGDRLFEVIESRDVVPLAWGENGFRELSNSRRAVRTPDDMAGLKIRFAAGAIFSDIFTRLGANPVQMSFADLQPALTTGAVDGQENPINLFLAFKMDTLAQRHLTVWNYVNDPVAFTVAKSAWSDFTKEDQALIRAAAVEAGQIQMALGRKGLGGDGDTSAFDELASRGVQVTVLTAEEKQAFADATRPVFERWAETVGTDLVAEAERVIAAAA